MNGVTGLNNKKVLFIAPNYFGYEKSIMNQLEELGAKVSYIQENIDYTSYKYHFSRKLPNKSIKSYIFEKYFTKQIEVFANIKFVYVFLIRCALIPQNIIKSFFNEN